jgi:hypothetical protein
MVMEKSNVVARLREKVCAIVFEKADGTLREMYATLREEFLPDQIDIEEEIQKRKPNDAALAVWDTESKGWRSFRWDRLKTVDGDNFVI